MEKKLSKSFMVKHMLLAFSMFLSAVVFFNFAQAQEQASRRAELEHQLAQLEAEAARLDSALKDIGREKQTLASETARLNNEIKRKELEIQRLTIIIRKTGFDIQNKIYEISELNKRIEKNRKAIGASILSLYSQSQSNTITILLKYPNLSDFFSSLAYLDKIRSNIGAVLGDYQKEKTLVESEKVKLETFEREQQDLMTMQEMERRGLGQKKKEKDELLRATQGKETVFQQLLNSKKKDIASLRTQLFYLERTGITAEQALQFADLAAKRTGIRTAFLLALLEVETGRQFEGGVITVGTNLGTGNWKTDSYDCYVSLGRRSRAEAEKKAFFEITEKLGLNPNTMPVSRRPSYGCGGAMGPAQFIPTTWLLFENRVARLTGHNPPNPWDVEDAFTAAALYLADSGAASKTAAGEVRAANTYISGNPRCATATCRWYANKIIALAREIERIL